MNQLQTLQQAVQESFVQQQYAQARLACLKLVELNPQDSHNYYLLALISLQETNLSEAENYLKKALIYTPDEVEYLNALGNLYQLQQQETLAIQTYQKILALQDNYAPALVNLSHLYQQKNNPKQALIYAQQAVHSEPSSHNILQLAMILQKSGQLDEALHYFFQLFSDHSQDWKLCLLIAETFHLKHNYHSAIEYYLKGLQLEPSRSELLVNLGVSYQQLGQIHQALHFYQKALNLTKDGKHQAIIHNNMGHVYKEKGQIDEAIHHYQKGLELSQYQNYFIHSNYLICLFSSPSITVSECCQAFQEWGNQHANHLLTERDFANDFQNQRPLKIGYLSPNFRRHGSLAVFEPLFKHHKKDMFELFAYAEVPDEDEHTQRLKSYFSTWRSTVGLSEKAIANQIQEDKIDILIDLAGHSGHRHRLLVFAYKPAPVQVTGLGFHYTSGLKSMDYLILDPHIASKDLIDGSSEEVYYVDSILQWSPPDFEVELMNSPHNDNGYITFGCANQSVKLNSTVLSLWCEILKLVPASKLHLRSPQCEEYQMQLFYKNFFESRQISAERLIFSGLSDSFKAYFEFYNSIDIALDPFPYNGCITSCDTLWMGVPIITHKKGMKVTASLLTNIGFEQWIAESDQDYLEKAVALAQTPFQTPHSLRQALLSSVICQHQTYTEQVEALYHQFWLNKTTWQEYN